VKIRNFGVSRFTLAFNWIDLRGGRAFALRKLEGARGHPPTTHALRPIAPRVAARCQPAPCSHPPPSSLGRALPTTASRSTTPLRVVHAGMHHQCTTLTGAALTITTLNGITLNGTTRDGNTIDAIDLCRLSLSVPVRREPPGGSRGLACVCLPHHADPDTCPLVPYLYRLLCCGAVQT
jgi:hypothetical protein